MANLRDSEGMVHDSNYWPVSDATAEEAIRGNFDTEAACCPDVYVDGLVFVDDLITCLVCLGNVPTQPRGPL